MKDSADNIQEEGDDPGSAGEAKGTAIEAVEFAFELKVEKLCRIGVKREREEARGEVELTVPTAGGYRSTT